MSRLFPRAFQIAGLAEALPNRRMLGMADFATSMLKEKPQSFIKTLVSLTIPELIPTKQNCSIWEILMITASFSLFKYFFWKSNREAAAKEEATIKLSYLNEQLSMLRSELCLEFSKCQMEVRAGLNKEHARREMEIHATLNKEHARREMEIRATLNKECVRREMEMRASINKEHARREMEISATLNKEHARREIEIRATLSEEHARREMEIYDVVSEKQERVAHLEEKVEECTIEKIALKVDLEKLKSDLGECKMLLQRYEDDTQGLGARVISSPWCEAAAASDWEDKFVKRFSQVFGSELRTVSLMQTA